MTLVNKQKDDTPFDMKRPPKKQLPILLPIIWGGSYLMTRQFGLKIEKVNMKAVKPPYLVLATHQGFSDYYIGPLAMFPHRAMYVSDMEGFAAFGKGLYRSIGCIGKRRYVPDIHVMIHIKSGQSVVIYPESRHSNIGVTASIPKNMGKLAKVLRVPLVILSVHGSYLANPFWNEEKTRKVPIKAKMECILTASELQNMDAHSVQEMIEKELQYDEYEYQHKEGFLIRDEDRAEEIEKALYQCIECKSKYQMTTQKDELKCNACGSKWRLSEDGWLVPVYNEECSKNRERIHVPNWYEFERGEVEKELSNTSIKHSYQVKIEALPNEKGFIDLGNGTLTLDKNEFTLDYMNLEHEKRVLHFRHEIRESVQTEYNYRNKGKCIVLSTSSCCYYLYSQEQSFEPTELQFIGELLYLKDY